MILSRLAVYACLTVAISTPCNADQRLDNFLDALAFARALENKCTSWMVEPAMVDAAMQLLKLQAKDILPNGKYGKAYTTLVQKYDGLTRGKVENELCVSAVLAFGPNGLMLPRFMRSRN